MLIFKNKECSIKLDFPAERHFSVKTEFDSQSFFQVELNGPSTKKMFQLCCSIFEWIRNSADQLKRKIIMECSTLTKIFFNKMVDWSFNPADVKKKRLI